jgi:hypothetical protein
MRPDLWQFLAPAIRKAQEVRAHEVTLSPHPTIKGLWCGELFLYWCPERASLAKQFRHLAWLARTVHAHQAWLVPSKNVPGLVHIKLFYQFGPRRPTPHQQQRRAA